MLLPAYIIQCKVDGAVYTMEKDRNKITKKDLEHNLKEHLVMLRGSKEDFIRDLDLSAEDQLPEAKRRRL